MKYRNSITGLLGVFLCMLLTQTVAAQPTFQEIVVNFLDSAKLQDIEEIETEYSIDLVYNSIFSENEVLLRFPAEGLTAEQTQELTQRLTAEEDIEYAEPNYLYQTSLVPNDPMYAKQWHLKMINMEKAWETSTGKGAVIAVIDTGVAFEDYKDSKGQYHRVPDMEKTKFVKGYDFIDNDEHANDDNGHGTHVAGTIAQSTNNKTGVAGVAYDASIMPLRVLNKYGYGNIADIAEAIVFAADHGANALNMSLGGGGESKLMREAIEYAYKKGVTIICAAGNEGRDRNSYPAAYPHAIGVSSVGPDGLLAPYSNHGTGTDIAAPGGNMGTNRSNPEGGVLQNTIGRSDPTKDSYEYFQGTSMAAPHVAGVAALIVSLGVKAPKDVEAILLKTARKKEDSSRYGAGILDAAAAVKAAKSADILDDGVPELQPKPPTASDRGKVQAQAKRPIFSFKETMLYFLAGIGFALVYFKLIKRGDGWGVVFSFLFTLGMFLTSPGVFFLSYLRIPFVPQGFMNFLASPIPNWDRVLLGHSMASLNPLFHSVLLPLVLIVLLLNMKSGRAFALGVALGFAAHLFIDSFFSPANVSWVPGTFFFDKIWLILNSFFCFGLAVIAGKEL